MTSVMVVAAETSSCLYAQRLMEHYAQNGANISWFGVGNQAMVDQGFEAIGRSEDLAVVGVSEIIEHWGKIKAAFNGLIAECEQRKPKFVLLLDYPEFNLKLARKLKAKGVKIVYYISPQLWAWRRSRVKIVKKNVDLMLVLFPFEKSFYERHGIAVDWVGHPILDELKPDYFSADAQKFLRGKFGIKPGDHVLGLMPGSRNSEIRHHFAIQLRTAKQLQKRFGGLRVVILVAPDFNVDDLRPHLQGLDLSVSFIKDEPFNMISICDTILVASGTATLMVGLLLKPMVVMYRMTRISAQIAKWFVRDTPFFAMVNLVVGSKICSELFQEEANVDRLSHELSEIIHPGPVREKMIENLAHVRVALGNTGATAKVAQALAPFFA